MKKRKKLRLEKNEKKRTSLAGYYTRSGLSNNIYIYIHTARNENNRLRSLKRDNMGRRVQQKFAIRTRGLLRYIWYIIRTTYS